MFLKGLITGTNETFGYSDKKVSISKNNMHYKNNMVLKKKAFLLSFYFVFTFSSISLLMSLKTSSFNKSSTSHVPSPLLDLLSLYLFMT